MLRLLPCYTPHHATPPYQVSLLPLSANAVGTLLREALRATSPIDTDVVRRVHQRCGGNPLFILSFAAKLAHDLRSVAEAAARERLQLSSDIPPLTREVYAASGTAALEVLLVAALEQKYIPSSLSEVVLAQLDRLTMQELRECSIPAAKGV